MTARRFAATEYDIPWANRDQKDAWIRVSPEVRWRMELQALTHDATKFRNAASIPRCLKLGLIVWDVRSWERADPKPMLFLRVNQYMAWQAYHVGAPAPIIFTVARPEFWVRRVKPVLDVRKAGASTEREVYYCPREKWADLALLRRFVERERGQRSLFSGHAAPPGTHPGASA